ncbi:uncharacterized protein LOC130622332 [Hydractinia symbiolongicarpus]|uniref:uncharacterized protein LOC130622332 n=1 Tax=Hydractinia symbiolongicarpus TaxID=13093 RepID=UPI00254DB029|nr:uncharacterized protein LOC130622332 [Hydractinia symbiolongicarpus]
MQFIWIYWYMLLITERLQSIVINRKEGADVVYGIKCNNTYSKEQEGKTCSCSNTSSAFTSDHLKRAHCFKLEELHTTQGPASEYITYKNDQRKITIKSCKSSAQLSYTSIWNYTNGTGKWNTIKTKEYIILRNNTFTIQNRSMWNGLLILYSYKCGSDNATNILIKFTGERKYPLASNVIDVLTIKATSTTTTTTRKESGAKGDSGIYIILAAVIIPTVIIVIIFIIIVILTKKKSRRRKDVLEKNYQSLKIKYNAEETYTTLDENKQYKMCDNYEVPAEIMNTKRGVEDNAEGQYEVPDKLSQDGYEDLYNINQEKTHYYNTTSNTIKQQKNYNEYENFKIQNQY